MSPPARRLALTIASILLVSACTTASVPTTPSPGNTGAPFPAPPGSTQPVSLQWLVDDLAGISSDARGVYLDGDCGVVAYLNDTGGFLAPGGGRSKCGYARAISANLGTTVATAVKQMGVLGLAAILPGTTGTAPVNVQTGLTNCAILRYNAETGADASVTATTTGGGARQWVVESVSPHLAGCYVSFKNGFIWDGVQRVVPLRVTITTH